MPLVEAEAKAEKRSYSGLNSKIKPNIIMTLAAIVCSTEVVKPIEKPMVATTIPKVVNEIINPATKNRGPRRCSLKELPKIIGSSGRTQGDKIVTTPAI